MRNSKLSTITIFGTAICLTLIVVFSQLGDLVNLRRFGCDAPSYVTMSEGGNEKVMVYYARRIFHPWIVGCLKPFLGVDIAFRAVGIFSLFLLIWISLTILRRDIGFPLVASVALIFLPSVFILYHNCYNQTLFFISLTALYCLFLIRKRYFMSLLVIFLMLLTRDEAIIILLSFILVVSINVFRGLNKKWYYLYAITGVAVGISSWCVIAYNTQGNVNIHHMPVAFCFIMRTPAFLMRNLTGFMYWVDTYKNLPQYPNSPLLVLEAPVWLMRISAIRQIGIYDWNPSCVTRTFLIILSVFGTAPTMLLYLLKKKGFRNVTGSLAFGTILISGCLLFILAVVAGFTDLRYYNVAWPVFFFIIPLFLNHIGKGYSKNLMAIMACYVLSAWLFTMSFRLPGYASLALIIIELFLHRYTWSRLSFIHERDRSLLPIKERF